MPIPINCEHCGMQVWYYEWAMNDAAEETFNIPSPYCPTRQEMEDDPAFCPYCGEPKRRSLLKHLGICRSNESDSLVEVIWENRAVAREKAESFCAFLDLMRRRSNGCFSAGIKEELRKKFWEVVSHENNSQWVEKYAQEKHGIKA